MSESEILYSESGRTGTHWEEAKPEDLEEDPFFEYQIHLYMKVGLFFGWSWREFMETPLPVTERLSEEIDFRLENFGSSPLLLNWNALGFLQAIAKAFGGGKKSE